MPAAILVVSLIAIITNNWGNDTVQRVSNFTRLTLQYFSTPQVVFTPVIVFAMFAFHLSNSIQIIWITVALILTVTTSSGDVVVRAIRRVLSSLESVSPSDSVAKVVAYQQPSLTMVRQHKGKSIPLKSFVLITDSHSPTKIALTLDLVG